MYKILIAVCSGTANRGTEALVRGTVDILGHAIGNENIVYTLSSSTPIEDKHENLPYISNYIGRFSPCKNILEKIGYKLRGKFVKGSCNFSSLLSAASEQDMVIVVGADNYDIAYNMFDTMHYLNSRLHNVCKGKLLLYDCSLNAESVNGKFLSELALFDMVTVRESVTMGNIFGRAKPENVYLFPDPAFSMRSAPIQLPEYWNNGKMVGVNLSTLILNPAYGKGLKGKITSAYLYLIDKILSETDCDLVFIPHVMKGADLNVLTELYANYESNRRVHIVNDEGLSAPQLKFVISKCEMFVGARTHATIAAYSTCVPTLVLGYSTKSIGIATDLFGSADKWVIPVQELESGVQLWNAFKDIYDNRESVKEKLKSIMPSYIQRSMEFGRCAKHLLDKDHD